MRVWTLLLACLLAIASIDVVDAFANDIFCGQMNCYEVLGVGPDVSPAGLKKAYRTLAMQWHPDKNKSPNAQKMFTQLAEAHDILNNPDMRQSYDEFLANPERVMRARYQYYRFKYVQSDPRIVIASTVFAISILQFFLRRQMHRQTMSMAMQLPQTQTAIRNRANELAAADAGAASPGSNKKGGKGRMDKYIELATQEAREAVVLHGGAAPIKVEDVFISRIFLFPHSFFMWLLFQLRWFVLFRVLGRPYGPAERLYLTHNALGMNYDKWLVYTTDNGQGAQGDPYELIASELWIKENMEKYVAQRKEEQMEKLKGTAQYKRYVRYMRKQPKK